MSKVISGRQKFWRALAAVYLVCLHIALLYLVFELYLKNKIYVQPSNVAVADPAPDTPVPTPLTAPSILEEQPTPEIQNTPAVEPRSSPAPAAQMPAQTDDLDLVIPVIGIKRNQLTDTYDDARSEGRVHDAIDIMAPGGAPVVAAGDGEIVKFFDSERGGITIYQISRDKKYFFYYAHLMRRADDIKEHQFVTRGTVIGYVGDTGNAGPGNYHLHFAISQVLDPKRYWEGTAINPYPFLERAREVQ